MIKVFIIVLATASLPLYNIYRVFSFVVWRQLIFHVYSTTSVLMFITSRFSHFFTWFVSPLRNQTWTYITFPVLLQNINIGTGTQREK